MSGPVACSQRPRRDAAPSGSRLGWVLAVAGAAAVAAAVGASPGDARSAAAQNWPPFVLVSGLLLIGLVADDDGLFAAAGHRLARTSRSGGALFGGAAVMIGLVTAVLNLDTSVAFLTPVLVYAARSRGEAEATLLYGCILLSNAGSLFLPGSNLTNLIVLGHLDITGGQFFARMWLPALAALVVTAAVIGLSERRTLRISTATATAARPPVVALGLASVIAATSLVVALRSPVLPVFAVGAVAITVRVLRGKDQPRRVFAVLGLPVLVGLFGLSVDLGTLGRVWPGPATLLSHLDAWGTAAMAAVCSVLVNNLPAASLLAARTPPHPYSLLIGAEPRREPVRHRVTGMVLVAPCCTS
jgi:arsenical pump membrane protein